MWMHASRTGSKNFTQRLECIWVDVNAFMVGSHKCKLFIYLANDAKSHSMGMISAFLTAPGIAAISLRIDCSASMAFCLVLWQCC